jgi:DNA-binding response OmpR family regulator
LNKQNKKRKILLVDDEHDNSSIFTIGLKDNGFYVDTFDDPISALSAFKPDFYDLLILDIKMPKMDGYELYENIRKIDNKVKVCFVTASVEEYREDYQQSFTSNISFLTKPITIDDLVKKVNEIIIRY